MKSWVGENGQTNDSTPKKLMQNVLCVWAIHTNVFSTSYWSCTKRWHNHFWSYMEGLWTDRDITWVSYFFNLYRQTQLFSKLFSGSPLLVWSNNQLRCQESNIGPPSARQIFYLLYIVIGCVCVWNHASK